LKVIYEKQQRHPTTRDTFAKLLGYGGLNGASAAIVSALSKFGLLEGHGEKLRVSEMGQDLVLHRQGDTEYATALQTAAFTPAFFRELRDQYPSGLPSEHSLRASLIKRGFNPKAIDGAVGAYRDTLAFLDQESEDTIAPLPDSFAPPIWDQNPTGSGRVPSGSSTHLPSSASPPGGQRAVMLPLLGTEWATLHAPFPLTESMWNQMMTVLVAMKPALTAPSEQVPQTPVGGSPGTFGEGGFGDE